MPSICFVCLGNICRSPTAEGVMNKLLENHNLQHNIKVDSAGTSAHHVGEPADPRSRTIALEHGYRLLSRSRQVVPSDGETFDLLIAMDLSNVQNLKHMIPLEHHHKISLLRDFDRKAAPHSSVPDPYYGGQLGFLNVLTMCERSCLGIIEHFYQGTIASD